MTQNKTATKELIERIDEDCILAFEITDNDLCVRFVNTLSKCKKHIEEQQDYLNKLLYHHQRANKMGSELDKELNKFKAIKIPKKHPEQEVTPELLQERINYLQGRVDGLHRDN